MAGVKLERNNVVEQNETTSTLRNELKCILCKLWLVHGYQGEKGVRGSCMPNSKLMLSHYCLNNILPRLAHGCCPTRVAGVFSAVSSFRLVAASPKLFPQRNSARFCKRSGKPSSRSWCLLQFSSVQKSRETERHYDNVVTRSSLSSSADSIAA